MFFLISPVAPRPSSAVTSVINAPVSICGAVIGLFESLDIHSISGNMIPLDSPVAQKIISAT